jgi:hypothetical protein
LVPVLVAVTGGQQQLLHLAVPVEAAAGPGNGSEPKISELP